MQITITATRETSPTVTYTVDDWGRAVRLSFNLLADGYEVNIKCEGRFRT